MDCNINLSKANMKNPNQKLRRLLVAGTTVIFVLALTLTTAQAQTYETSLTSSVFTENFDELGQSNCTNSLPAGWIIAQGEGLPKYGGPIVETNLFYWTNVAPQNYNSYSRILEGGASGCPGDSATPTSGGRINLGDAASGYNNRCLGFLSANTNFESPTNFIMLGFYNNTGSNIISLAITNDFKQYRLNSTAATVTFYYSYDGTNWTHFSAGDYGPFLTGSSSTYFFSSGPIVTNKSFTISSLNISNGSPFYLSWQFIMASANGSFSPILGLDDFGLVATYGTPVLSGTSTWTNTSGNWATAANWQGSSLPVSGNNLVFAGSGGSSTNNLAAVTSGTGTVGSILFTNGAGGYTLSGSGVTLGSGLTNNSGAAQTIDLPITLSLDETFAAASNSLTFGGAISNGGNGATFSGSSNITLNGAETGTGTLNKSGSGILFVNASNSYTGLTSVNAGTLRMGSSGSIAASSGLDVAASATFDLASNNVSVSNLAGAGDVTLGSGTLTLTATTGSATFSGAISGTGGVSLTGGGTESVTGTNYYTGPTLLTAGLLELANVATLGSGPLVLDGGTFQLTGTRSVTTGILSNSFVLAGNTIVQNSASATAGTRNLPFSGTVVATNGTLTIQNIATGNFTNYMYLWFSGSVTNFTQPIVFDSSLAGSQVNNLSQIGSFNTNGTPPQVFSGPISGDGYFIRDALVAGTGGMTVLSGQNTFTWDTLVDHGYIGIGADSVTSGSTIVSSPVGLANLQFNDDTINGVAGVGVFAYGGPHTIANAVVLNGVTNTAIIGSNDLTLAGTFNPGGLDKILTVSNTGLTTISGVFTTNPASLTKSGPGALALTADNSPWGGGWTVAQGTLLVNNTSGSGTGTNPVTVTSGTLAGTGYVAGAVVVAPGAVAPGNPIGILTLEDGVDLSGGGTLDWSLAAEATNGAGVSFNQLAVTGGTVTLGGASTLTLLFTNAASAPTATDPFWQTTETWPIITLGGGASVSGNFSSIINGSYPAGTFSTSVGAGVVLLTFTPGPPKTPSIAAVSLTGTQLSLVVTNGAASTTFYVVTSTNIAQPVGSWLPVSTNVFSGNGMFTNRLTINPSEGQRYYAIKTQ